MAKAKQYKLKFKPTPIARLLKRPRTPLRYVGYPHASNWDRYYKLNYEFMIAEKRKGQPKPRRKPVPVDREQFENHLLAANYEKIGSGRYANVFAKPGSNIAIKVAEPDAWPQYVKWATEQGYAGTFAQKVYSLKFYSPKDKPPFYVATMERLVDTIGNIRSQNSQLKSQYIGLRDIVLWGRSNALDEYPDLKAFANDLKANGFTDDLHDGNIMVRKDGQMVVTDPLSHRATSNAFRIRHSQVVQLEN